MQAGGLSFSMRLDFFGRIFALEIGQGCVERKKRAEQ